jgi:hypothetical protein
MEIAAELGITFGRVYQILRAENVPVRPKSAPKEELPSTPKIAPDRVVDRMLRFLTDHPGVTVTALAEGVDHPNPKTVGQILSRLKKAGQVVAVREPNAPFHCLWSLPATEIAKAS